MRGFEGYTNEQIRRMPKGELHRRGIEQYGFWGWQRIILEANAVNIAFMVLLLVGLGLWELIK